ncbi:MAG: hypothetical protein GX493_11595 [Firmicutes bacterium]|nr:hypothetical protein [Bacillota bacterium]
MGDETYEGRRLAELLGRTDVNLEALFGLRLLARRLQVEKVSHLGTGKMGLEISGDGMGPALEVLGQLLGLADVGGSSPYRGRAKPQGKGSFWRALRDFVLPPEG